MPVVYDHGRQLATIEEISEISSIEGADRIVAAKVRDWTVVVRKDEFNVGDVVVFFEIDSALPMSMSQFDFLATRGTKQDDDDGGWYHVLKTVRLKGVYSQGLVLPIDQFFDEYDIGSDVTEKIGIGKWEKPLPNQGVRSGLRTKGSFPSEYANKTDSERIQNLGNIWSFITAEPWVITEKVDGTSLTVLCDYNGDFRVCSRNWEIHEGDNLYWNVARQHFFDSLKPGEVIQAEIVGPGIQGNPLGLSKVQPFMFSFIRDRKYLPFGKMPVDLWNYIVPFRTLERREIGATNFDISPYSIQELISEVDGIKSKVNPERSAEGLVFHTLYGNIIPQLGRNTFKIINNRYLLKK